MIEADIRDTAAAIMARRVEIPAARAVLVGVSGIDASGKGFVAARLAAALGAATVRAVALGADDWLNLPHLRFSATRPAEHFYQHGLRLDEMFSQLVLPLKTARGIRLDAELADATDAPAYRRHIYRFDDVAVIILEGIFLFHRAYRDHFDLRAWIDCSFETALERALARGQEGLPPDQSAAAFQTVYFPAQRIHFAVDDPRAAADLVIVNDPRLAGRAGV